MAIFSFRLTWECYFYISSDTNVLENEGEKFDQNSFSALRKLIREQ